ncbi:MAG: hypothetical protein JSU79_08815 [Dehalococcoidales bacterium]|nr:MAG: hypothetical protein JSU79_08815 [Dehalococcoidales bacterium]
MSIFIFIKKFFNKYGKYIIRTCGIIGLVAAIFFLAIGIYFLCQNSTTKDSQDFFSTWNFEVQRDSRAIVLEPDGIEFDVTWDMREIGLFKVVTHVDTLGKELFIGSAPVEDSRSYFTGVEHDKITGLWIFPPNTDYQRFNGDKLPINPALQDFWIDTVSGKGTKELIWDTEHDSLIIMNADGSAGLDLNVLVKTKVGILLIAGLGSLMIGVFILLLSLMAILYTRRTPNVVYPRPLIVRSSKKENQEANT